MESKLTQVCQPVDDALLFIAATLLEPAGEIEPRPGGAEPPHHVLLAILIRTCAVSGPPSPAEIALRVGLATETMLGGWAASCAKEAATGKYNRPLVIEDQALATLQA